MATSYEAGVTTYLSVEPYGASAKVLARMGTLTDDEIARLTADGLTLLWRHGNYAFLTRPEANEVGRALPVLDASRFNVPAVAQWIAADANGDVYPYSKEPRQFDGNAGAWYYAPNELFDDTKYKLATIDMTGIDWRQSLTPVNRDRPATAAPPPGVKVQPATIARVEAIRQGEDLGSLDPLDAEIAVKWSVSHGRFLASTSTLVALGRTMHEAVANLKAHMAQRRIWRNSRRKTQPLDVSRFELSPWAKWIAADENGVWHEYDSEPEIAIDYWLPTGQWGILGKSDLRGVHWSKTLTPVNQAPAQPLDVSQWQLSPWAKWVAADADGNVNEYGDKPATVGAYFWSNQYKTAYNYLGNIDLTGIDWRQTLTAVNQEQPWRERCNLSEDICRGHDDPVPTAVASDVTLSVTQPQSPTVETIVILWQQLTADQLVDLALQLVQADAQRANLFAEMLWGNAVDADPAPATGSLYRYDEELDD